MRANVRNRSVWIVAGALAACGLAASQAAERPVDWEEVAALRRMGTRWAAGVDAAGLVLAIYDLSFPDPRGRIYLGRVGRRRMTREAWAEARRAAREIQGVEGEPDEADRGLEVDVDPWPEGWWKELPWKNGAKATAEPESFRLSELDWDRLIGASAKGAAGASDERRAKFEQALALLMSVREPDGRGAALEADFLERFGWERRADSSGYELFYDAPAVEGRVEPGDSRAQAQVTRPKKIADLRHKTALMWEALAWDAVDNALDLLVGVVPIPWVSAILGVAVNRFFLYREHLFHLHQEMAREMLVQAEEGGGFAPFAVLSASDREASIESLQLSDSSLTSVWRWIFRGPRKAWRKAIDKDAKRARQAREWLQARGEQLRDLNGRFGVGQEPSGRQRLYLMARSRLSKKCRPSAAVNYARPINRRALRWGLEALSAALDFGSRFIPWVGSLAFQAYYYAVEKPVKTTERWEARLVAHLEQRHAAGEDWSYELKLLDGQTVSPFETSREVAFELVRQRERLRPRWGAAEENLRGLRVSAAPL